MDSDIPMFDEAVLAKTQAPPYKPPVIDDNPMRLNLVAHGIFVKKNDIAGTFVSTVKAILPPNLSHDDTDDVGRPFIVATDEEDISSRLAAAKEPKWQLTVGICWDTYEMTSMFCFDNAVLEYRRNIGIPTKTNNVTGRAATYMVTYAVVGIPIARYKWLAEKLKIINIDMVDNPKDNESNGYMWMTANITQNYIPLVALRLKNGTVTTLGDERMNLKQAIINARQNVIGVISSEIKMKRAPGFTSTNRHYFPALTLRGMQIIDLTDIRAPPLVRALEFETKDTAISDELLKRLRGPEKPDLNKANPID